MNKLQPSLWWEFYIHAVTAIKITAAFEWKIQQLDMPAWQPLVTMAGLRVTQCALPIFWPIKLSEEDCGVGKVTERDKGLQSDTRDVLDKEYVFTGSEKLKRLSIEADCTLAGLQVRDVYELLELLTDELPYIDERRTAYIARADW